MSGIAFPDLSNHDTAQVETGTPVVIAKATEGKDFTDVLFQQHKKQAANVGAVFMGYHWPWSATDEEVAHAFSVIGPEVPAMIDAENLKVLNTASMISAFTTKYRKIGGTVHMLYLPHWYWEGHIGAPDLRPLEDLGLSIISSNYTTYSDDGIGWDPYGGVTPTQWQNEDDHHYGGDFTVDWNHFKGTKDEYAKLISGGQIMTSVDLNQDGKDAVRRIVTDVVGDAFGAALTGRDVGDFTAADRVWVREPGLRELIKATASDASADLALDQAQPTRDQLKNIVNNALAALPPGSVQVSDDQVNAAVDKAFKDAFGGTA